MGRYSSKFEFDLKPAGWASQTMLAPCSPEIRLAGGSQQAVRNYNTKTTKILTLQS
jgi:hypothetical protein